MREIIIVTDSVLAAIGFVCICLSTDMYEKSISKALRKIVFPGALAGGAVSLLIFTPIGLLNVVLGMLSGILTAEVTALLYIAAQMRQKENPAVYYDDGSPAKYFITGDKHRNFTAVKRFCCAMNTRRKDVLIILGDAGFNYYGDKRDDKLKEEISSLNITLFCIHGNKEAARRMWEHTVYEAFAAARSITSRNIQISILQSTVKYTHLREKDIWLSAVRTVWIKCAALKKINLFLRMKCPMM